MIGSTIGTKSTPEKMRRQNNRQMWDRKNLPPVTFERKKG